MARPPELDEPPVMHDPVDHRSRELVVPQDRPPFAELDVGREDYAPPLVAGGDHLEQQPRAFHVDRHVPELVEYDKVVPFDVLHHRLEAVLPVGLRQRQRQLGGGVEPDGLAGHHACAADRDGQVRLAAPGLPVEHEVLGRIDERQALEVVHAVAVRERDLREVVPVERFELREPRINAALVSDAKFSFRAGLRYNSEYRLQIGETVTAYGFADGKDELRRIEATVAEIINGNQYRVNRAYIHGMSGGPVLNSRNEVVGMVVRGSAAHDYAYDGEFLSIKAILEDKESLK